MEGHDFSVGQLHGDQTGQRKFKENRPFIDFITRIASAPISKNINQTNRMPTEKSEKTQTQPDARTNLKKEERPAKDAAVEFVERNWRPGSKR